MQKYIFLLVGFSLLTILSCTKELPYPNVDSDDVLVLNGLIDPIKGANIHLSKSCHLTEANCSQNNVKNAKVILKDEAGTELTELQHQSGGHYTAEGFAIEHDKTYQIEASSTGYETVRSTTYIPKPNDCTLINVGEEILLSYLCRTFEIEINDNPGEENYYLIGGWVDIINGEHDFNIEDEYNNYTLPHTGFVTNDVNADNQSMIAGVDYIIYPLEFIFLTDVNFNGEQYPIKIGLFEEDLQFHKELVAHISVKSVSKELYDYYKSVTNNKLTSGNILAEPYQIVNNIEKGIGIWGGYSEVAFEVELPRSEYFLPEDLHIENAGCTSPCSVTFTADMGAKVVPFWRFGDGNSSTDRNPVHQYQEPGMYGVELEINLGTNKVGWWTEIEIK